MGHFKQLLSLDVVHEFHAPRPCRALQFWPAARTAAALANTGCLFRQLDGGFEVCHDQDGAAALQQQLGQAEPWTLRFVAASTDPQFVNYTANLLERGPTWYCEDTAATTAQRRLQLMPAARSFEPLDWQGKPVPRCVVLLRLDARLLERAPLQYQLPLAARATRWKYYFTGGWLAQPLRIVDAAGLLQFDAAREERLADGRSAQVIMSSTSIALQERPPQRPALRALQGGVDRVLIKRLPLASPARLARDSTANAPSWLSEIYVAS